MPELPEVETSRRGIAPHIEGREVSAVILRHSQLRWPIPADLPAQITGRKLNSVARRGKYLLLDFGVGTVLIHLGMSGSLRIVKAATAPAKHDHFDIAFGDIALRYTDPRRFGALLWTQENSSEHELIAGLGPEPLSEEFNADYLYRKSRARKQALKAFIMDSKQVVGVGNIYANESLFMAGLRPRRAAGRLTRGDAERLVDSIKTVLARAIAEGGTTLKDFVGGDGKPGYFAQQLMVYGRGGEPCVNCGDPLKELVLAQRATVYCPNCQK